MEDTRILEFELTRKLLLDCHLSVPERDLLPAGKARFSTMVHVVEASLSDVGWFPPTQRPTDPLVSFIIEKRDGDIWTHEAHEVGMMRMSPIRSKRCKDVPTAVRQMLRERDTDGVAVDFDL